MLREKQGEKEENLSKGGRISDLCIQNDLQTGTKMWIKAEMHKLQTICKQCQNTLDWLKMKDGR